MSAPSAPQQHKGGPAEPWMLHTFQAGGEAGWPPGERQQHQDSRLSTPPEPANAVTQLWSALLVASLGSSGLGAHLCNKLFKSEAN